MRTEESQKFINDVFSTARFRGMCRTRGEFASLLGVNKSCLSTVMNGNPQYLTRSFLAKVQRFAFEHDFNDVTIPTSTFGEKVPQRYVSVPADVLETYVSVLERMITSLRAKISEAEQA